MKIIAFAKYILCCHCWQRRHLACDENDGIPCECNTKVVPVVDDGMVEIVLE
jgi:hypothetical protein